MAAVAVSSSMSMTFAVSPRVQFHAAIICGSPPSDSLNTTIVICSMSTYFSAPCRIRALLHPAPLLLLVIVVTLSAGFWSAYPLYISALVFWRRPLYFLHISPYKKRAALRSPSDGSIISHKSCCIVLTFIARYDLSAFPRLAVPGPLPNPAIRAFAALSFPSTRF